MKFLLDTDIVIDFLTGQDQIRALFTQLLPQGAAISILTFAEIYEGIEGSRNPEAAEAAFLTFLQGVPVLNLTRTIARRNAQLRLHLRRHGRPITHRAIDLLIAATALHQQLTLVTRNVRDYEDIPELDRLHP